MIEFDSRRLTGANFFCDQPAVVVDVQLPLGQEKEIIAHWGSVVTTLHQELKRPVPEVMGHRLHDLGQSLFFTAEIDALYTSIDLAEVALKIVLDANVSSVAGATTTANAESDNEVSEEPGGENSDEHYQSLIVDSIPSLASGFAEEACPNLLALEANAEQNNVPFLWDDDYVSLGYGSSAQVWPADQLPSINEEPSWENYHSIPLAFITGTNGKSTTTRLASQILRGSGKTVGFSSTDGIWAGDECLDQGDYSGPGGAREVLRNHKVEAAILEVARGGLLRRGLGAARADVALVTNVAEDHLGEYGVNTLAELIEAKFVVRKSLSADGKLVLNADDEGIVSFVDKLGAELKDDIVWFSLDARNVLLTQHCLNGGTAYFLDDENLVQQCGKEIKLICSVMDVPITLKGAAKYNTYNALAAAALTNALGVPLEQIREGLCSFVGDKESNPGRGNLFTVKGATMMVDFAHNPHGLNAVVDTLLQFPAKRRLVMLGHAGDRSDDDIRDLTKVAARLEPDLVVIYELESYLRGRNLGDIPALISEVLLELGISKEQVIVAPNPATAAQHAVAWAKEGDVLLLQALTDREEVFKLLEAES